MVVLLCWHFLTRDEPRSKTSEFDVSVGTGYGQRVANLDLMNQRQNGIIISAVVLVVGVLMHLFGKRPPPPNPPNPFEK